MAAVDTKRLTTLGDDLYRRTEKINAELFALTYGALVVQLIKDYEDFPSVNQQLDKMGYNIGTRLIEDFLARSSLPRCSDFRQVGETMSRVAFKTFLGITPTVTHNPQFASGLKEFTLHFEENPLAEFVELPEEAMGLTSSFRNSTSLVRDPNHALTSTTPTTASRSTTDGLWYSQVLCGVIRGALDMIGMEVDARFVSDVLRGDDSTEMKVRLVKYVEDEVPQAED